MNKYKLIILLLLAAIIGLLTYLAFFKPSMMPMQSNVQTQDKMLWIGPGLYYGVWFESEADYNSWYENNYRRQGQYERPDDTPNRPDQMQTPRDPDGAGRFQGGARSGGGRGR